MDSSVASDPRFKLVAAALDVKWTEVIGSCFLLWLACYDRRSERLRKIEADIAADMKGFADALIQEGLATDCGEGLVLIHGVKERIKFLIKQAENGAKGGKSTAKKNKKARKAKAQAVGVASATGGAAPYTPDHTPDLSLTPDQHMSEVSPSDLDGSEKELPENAIRCANYLRNHIVRVDPEHGLAKSFPPSMVRKWSKTFDFIERLDKRSWDEIRDVIKWLYTTENTYVIQSPASLRKKFDKVRTAMRRAKGPEYVNGQRKLPPPKAPPPQPDRPGETRKQWESRVAKEREEKS